MITPFDDNGKIDWLAYREMDEWYISHNVGGLYANCQSSEMYALDNDERVQLAVEAVKVAGGRVPVAATGNLGESIEEHIALSRRIAETGVDIVMFVVPTLHDNDDDLRGYYFTLAEKVDAPLGLYECPVPRRYHLGIDLVRALAQSGRFVAYKETSENLEKILALQEVTGDTPLSLLQACSAYLLESVRAGGLGSMCIAAIHLPDLVAAVIKKARAGDPDAERLQAAHSAMHLAQRAAHPHAAKYLLCKRGLPISDRCRRQNAFLTPETRRALDYAARDWFDHTGELRVLQC
jgi:4-hydroxy-tetrahydrodipicolinate synthase